MTPTSVHVLKYADDAWAWTVCFKDAAHDVSGLSSTFRGAMGEVERVTSNAGCPASRTEGWVDGQ